MPDFRIGLLGHGTVGGAFATLLERRAGEIEATTGLRPRLAGVLTRSRGEFGQILADSDLVVEVMGGVDPAREHVLAAMAAGRHVVTANKQLLSRHGEELWALAREHGVQLRFEAAVAGVVPVIRVLQESLAAAHVERLHGIVNGTTNFILSEMARTGESYDTVLAEAQRLGYAESDPTEDVSGEDAAAKMAILARLAFATPVHLDQVRFEGIEHIAPDDLEYARELGLSLKLIGTAERVDGGLNVRVHPAFLYPGHPLASVNGPYNAVTVESADITEITMSGPGAGGPQTASAVLGDVISAMIPPASTPEPTATLEVVQDVASAFYLHLEVADRPGVLAQVAQVLGMQGASIKSVVQKGLGEKARLVMVVHPLAESRFFAALELIARLEFVRARPRAIRVIEEEFTSAVAQGHRRSYNGKDVAATDHAEGATPPAVRLLDAEDAPLLARPYFAEGLPSPITRSLAHVPELLDSTMSFVGAALGASALDERTKEIVILRASAVMECRYCVATHSVVALDCGLTADEVAALRAGSIGSAFAGERDRALIAWTDAVAAGRGGVATACLNALGEHFDEPAVVELTLVAAATLMLNRYASALGLPPAQATLARLREEGLA